MSRIIILYIPSLVGLLWGTESEISIIWSLGGSLFIAAIAQTRWFAQSDETLLRSGCLLRPAFMYHLSFVAVHVVGCAFHGLDNAGYRFWGQVAEPSQYKLSLDATAQRLMLLAQASVTAGMKLGNPKYGPPKYTVSFLPSNT